MGNLKINLSKQISLTYGLILFIVMFFTGILTTGGVYYLFFHQAERALDISINRTIETAPQIQSLDENFFNTIKLLPSVTLRVTNSTGKVILDSSPTLPETAEILKSARQKPPLFANPNYTLIETEKSFLYYKEISLKIGTETFNFHFLRMITFERQYIRHLLRILFAINLIGLFMAVIAGGIFIKQRLLNKIEENFNRQQQFILDASHEFKTPITIIHGYSDMLKSFGTADPELVAEAAEAIQNSSKNMQTLVENLLFLAHADQNNQPLNKVPVEIHSLLREVVESFKNPRLEFIGNEKIEIIGDAEALKKMFAAFIDNALIYSSKKVTVTIENSTVKIIDSGIGIAPENLNKIFDRFFRADKSRTKIDGKSLFGLGLPIAKWIADNHEIKIKIDSTIGAGSTFTLTFAR